MKQSKTKIAYKQCEDLLSNKQWADVYKLINKKSVNLFDAQYNIFNLVKKNMVNMPIQPKKDLYKALLDKGEKDFDDICHFYHSILFKKNIKDYENEKIDFDVSSEMLSVLDLHKQDPISFESILIFSRIFNNNQDNNENRNLAHYFAGFLSREQMLTLEKQSVDFMIQDSFGMYPLHYALFQLRSVKNISGIMYLMEKHVQKNIEVSYDWDMLSDSNDLLKYFCLDQESAHSAFLTMGGGMNYSNKNKDSVFSENINNLSLCEMSAYSLFYSHRSIVDVHSNLLVYLADRPELYSISGFDNIDFNKQSIFHKIIKHRNKQSVEMRNTLDSTTLFSLFDILLDTPAVNIALKQNNKGCNFLHLIAQKTTHRKDLLIRLAEKHINKSYELFQQKNNKNKSPLLSINKNYYHKLGPVMEKEIISNKYGSDNKPSIKKNIL